MDSMSTALPSLGNEVDPRMCGSTQMFSGDGTEPIDLLSGELDITLVKPPSFVDTSNSLVELERQKEEAEKEAELQKKLAEQQAYEATSGKEIELPVGNYSDSDKLMSKADVYDMLERGTQVAAKQVTDGEEFELPAVMLDLSECASVYPICLEALRAFCKKTPDVLRCGIYVRNSAKQVYLLGHGDINELHSSFPGYVDTLFGEDAKVKNIVCGEDGVSKLKKLSSGIKTFRFNLNYAF